MLSLILICVVFGLLFLFQRNKNKNEPPVLAGGLPLIGHAHLLLGNSTQLWKFFKYLHSEIKKHNTTCYLHVGPMQMYFVSEPEDFLMVANTCLQKNKFYEFAKSVGGEGLITGTVPIWKIHRKLLNPAFNQRVLDGFLDVFNKQSRRLVNDLETKIGKSSFDHYTYTKHISLETLCLTALGVDLNEKSVLNSQYIMALDVLSNLLIERFQKPWLYSNMIFNMSTMKKTLDENSKVLKTMCDTILQKTKVEYLKNKNDEIDNTQGYKFKTFMHLLIELSVDKGVLSDLEIKDETNTMIAAGYETSATALMFCILMIGSYPTVQEKVFEELNEVFGDDDRDVTKHDLSRLIYLEAVLKETLRVYPIVPMVARHLDKDVELSNCTLSKGSTGFMFIYGVHHSPIWGLDAEEFKPERWLDAATLPKSANAFVAFSAGKRNCIGKGYAIMFLKTTLAHVFRHYKVKGDHTKVELKFDVTLKPLSGHHISIQRKNSKNYV